MRRTGLSFLVVLCLSTTGCGGGTPLFEGSLPTTAGTTPESTSATVAPAGDVSAAGTWTVMVYAIGDNNLEASLLTDMLEMRDVTEANPDIRFIVLADRSTEFTAEELGRLGNWTTTKLVEVADGRFTENADWGERNLGDPAVLVEFLTTASSIWPADHYGLVFWDHGAMSGIGPDEDPWIEPWGDVLEPAEIASSLESGLTASDLGTLDLLGFDACLMASLEVVSTVSRHATYLIASEEIEPGEGWDYAGFDYLAATADPTVAGLGTAIVSAYEVASAATSPYITMSLLDLRQFDAFADVLAELTDKSLDTMDVTAVAFGRRRDRVRKFGSDPNPERDWFMVDLGQLLRRMGRSETPVAETASQAAQLLRDMVVANITGEAAKGAQGLSVHFPPAPDWFYADWYAEVGWPVWGTFLEGYFGTGRDIELARRPSIGPGSTATEHEFDEFGITVATEFNGAAVDSVVSAEMWSGIEEPDGSITFYAADQGFVIDATAFALNDLTRLILSDGEDEIVAFQKITFGDEGDDIESAEDLTTFTLTVPLWYRAPIDPAAGKYKDGVDISLIFTFNMDTLEGTQAYYATSPLGTVGAFSPEPTGLLFGKLPHRAPGGEIEWLPSSDVGVWANPDALTFDFVDLPSGTQIRSELTVSDFGGNTATAVVSALIP